jgi:hypothetical protein
MTIRELAGKLGLSKSSVAYALHGGEHIPRTIHNFLHSFQQFFRRAKDAGRKRIGLVMHESQNKRVRNHILCGFLGEQALLPASLHIC